MEVAESSPLSGGKSENTFQKINTTWLATVKAFSGISTAHNALLNFPTHAGICRLYLYIMTPLHMQPQPQERELKLKVGTCPDSAERNQMLSLGNSRLNLIDSVSTWTCLLKREGIKPSAVDCLSSTVHGDWEIENSCVQKETHCDRHRGKFPGLLVGLQLLVLYFYEVCVQSHPWVHLSLERLLLPWADLCYLHPGFLINNYLGPTNPSSENCAKFCV